MELINILTRTSNRPNYFKHCVESVVSQDYKNINHLICVDDTGYTYEYVKPYNFPKVIYQVKQIKSGVDHAPYNLYINSMLSHVKEGWVIILDDDDKLMRPDSLSALLPYMTDTERLLLWKVQFPHSTVPSVQLFGNTPTKCNISMIGFSFHISQLKDTQFNDTQTGDFDFIYSLYNRLNPIWIDKILTGLQRTNAMGGFGSYNDLKQ